MNFLYIYRIRKVKYTTVGILEGLMIQRVNNGTIAVLTSPAQLGRLERAVKPLRVALPILLRRSILSYQRSSFIINARITQVVGFSVIITLF